MSRSWLPTHSYQVAFIEKLSKVFVAAMPWKRPFLEHVSLNTKMLTWADPGSLELKQSKIEQRNAIVKHSLRVLILLSAAVLINQLVWAMEFGEPPPKVELKEKLGGRLDAKLWSSDELQGKVSVVFYVSPDEKDTNNPASEALDKEKFPADRFVSYGIINMAASMLPNFVINSFLKEKQERYPRTIYVRDYNKVLVHAWGIADHSSNVMVFDKKGTVIFRKDGKLTAEEIQKLVKTVRDNL